jgi:nucleotide-binding universal stress UspA family protein
MSQTSGHEVHMQSPGSMPWRRNLITWKTFPEMGFKSILFATDFSPVTNLALPYAIEIARRSGAMIHAVHVVSPDIYPLVPPAEWNNMATQEQEFRNRKQAELEEEFHGLPHEFLSPKGDVWQCLARVIKDRCVDLIVLGTHGRTGIEKVVFGSDAERIFRQATCPVLTVGSRASARATHAAAAELNCILYATDFSSESFGAARYAISLAKDHHAQLILLHAIENAEAGQVSAAVETLRDVVPLGANLAPRPRYTVERGAPASSILGAAQRDGADLIVLGIRGADGHVDAATHFSTSIAYETVTRATCPVLTVRG